MWNDVDAMSMTITRHFILFMVMTMLDNHKRLVEK